MPIKSRLLASALIPVMAGWFSDSPARATPAPVTFEIAQAQPLPPEGEPQPAPEEPAAAGESGGGEIPPVPQAEDSQPGNPPQSEAPPPAADNSAEQPPPQEEVPPQAGDDGGQPERPRRPRPDAERTDEGQPAPRPQGEAQPQAGEDGSQPERPRRPRPDAERTDEGQPVVTPQGEAPAPAGNDAEPPPPPEEPQPEAGQVPDEQPQVQPPEPQPPEAGQAAEPVPAEPQRPPAPPIEDRRTESELRDEAADPSKTDDTVVLPVDNGAAVLDSDKDADNRGGQSARDERRRDRERQRQQDADQPPPRNDAEAQRLAPSVSQADIEAGSREQGRRRDSAPDFFRDLLAPLVQGQDRSANAPRRFEDRAVYETDGGIVVRSDERQRLRRAAEETYYEDLARGRVRETIVRPDGLRIVTIYSRYGDVIQRTRVMPDGREYLLVYAPEADSESRPPVFRDPGDDLPPMRLRIPVRDYIVDTSSDPGRDYYDFLSEPPVEQVERVYTVDEVKYSARLRDKVRRIDLDTVTFSTGSAEVPMSQARTVRSVAEAIGKILDRDPGETFLIEGHTDAVGSDESNLVLSDRRAESIANLLTDVYGIPPENLVTQGYGERYLKVRTQAAEQQNRRVTIRRVTSLVRPVAQGG